MKKCNKKDVMEQSLITIGPNEVFFTNPKRTVLTNCRFETTRYIKIDDLKMDTLWKRLKWLFTGRVK